MKKNIKRILFLSIGGLLAGFANGLLGAGGGIIIIFVLSRVLRDKELSSRELFANALCVMFPISIVSCIIYTLRGTLSLSGFGVYLLPAIAGGVVGGFLLGRINEKFLRKLFAAIIVYSGIMLIIK